MMQPYQAPHACETAEIAALLGALSPRQRRVLREYVWKVELGELGVTDWLRSAGCPVSERAWYGGGEHANYLHSPDFQAALAAYRAAGQRWALNDEERQIAKARSALVRAAPRAADRIIEHAESDMSQLWHLQYVWVEDVQPTQEILAKRKVQHPLVEGVYLTEYLVARPVLDLEKLRNPKYGRLIKKLTDSPRGGLSVEFYDAQRAAESILDRADKGTASKSQADITLRSADELTDDELAAIAGHTSGGHADNGGDGSEGAADPTPGA